MHSSRTLIGGSGALPDEWIGQGEIVDAALSYVAWVRDNIQAAVNEVRRVLR